MLKVEKLIKNTASRLHHIHQRRGVFKTPLSQTSKTEISAKTARGIQSLTVFAKNFIPEIWPGS